MLSKKISIYESDNHTLFINYVRGPRTRPLITVSNHISELDDPLIWSVLLPKEKYTSDSFRWIPGAKEIMFDNPLYSWFFRAGRVYPIIRGAGIYQEGMDISIELLNKNSWIHIFPEGKVNQSGKLFSRFKWGVGRMIYESDITPIVIPIYFSGLDILLPIHRKNKVLPHRLDHFQIIIGNPLDLTQEIEQAEKKEYKTDQIYSLLTYKIWQEMNTLCS